MLYIIHLEITLRVKTQLTGCWHESGWRPWQRKYRRKEWNYWRETQNWPFASPVPQCWKRSTLHTVEKCKNTSSWKGEKLDHRFALTKCPIGTSIKLRFDNGSANLISEKQYFKDTRFSYHFLFIHILFFFLFSENSTT